MLKEVVVVNTGRRESARIPVAELPLPDLRMFIPFLNDEDTSVVLYVQKDAETLLRKITSRRVSSYHEDMFQRDVPDMDSIGKQFPAEERAIFATFEFVYTGLLRHFMPKAEVRNYLRKDENGLAVHGGKRYTGLGWHSPDLE